MRLVLRSINSKIRVASLVILLSVFFIGCANSCVSGFWNPPSGTIGTVISNPPPTCQLATPKGAIRLAVQVSGSCDSCSVSNRVHTVVLNLRGIDVHSSANAAGESPGWQPLLPEPGKYANQVEFLSEKMNFLFSESTEELAIPAGSYDLVRLRLAQNRVVSDGDPLPENKCGQAGTNCAILADGQIAPLVFEADVLEFHLTSEVTVDGLLFVVPGGNNELLIELTPVLSTAGTFAEGTGSFSILPGRARIEPRPGEEALTVPTGFSRTIQSSF